MDSLNNTYTTYNNVSFYLPLILLILSPTTLILMWLMYAICCAHMRLKYFKETLQQWNIVVNILKQIYGDYLEDCNGDNKSGDQYSKEIGKIKVTMLFTGVIGIYFCAAISFWSDLIVEETTQCDVQMDCFALNASTGILQQEIPLMDECINYKNDGYTIQCFRFVFNYINAIGNAGSVIIVGALVMNVQSAISALIVSSKRKFAKWVLILYFIFFSYAPFVVIIFLNINDVIESVVFPTRKAIVQFTAYYVAFMYAFTVSGPLFTLNWSCIKSFC